MTRFARAKGSKSSNERLPHEATPWHVMKEQLNTALDKEQESLPKKKSAKELLNEKEQYYPTSLGNLNNDWAEFEAPKNKLNSVKNSKVEKKSINKKQKIKKAVEKSIEVNVNKSEFCQASNEAEDISKPTEKKCRKNKKNKEKIKVKSESNIEKQECAIQEKQSHDGIDNKIQQHNAGNNQQKSNENKKCKNRHSAAFNVHGNDWNNSIASKSQELSNCKQDKNVTHNDFQKEFKKTGSDNINDKNFRRFGNNVPRKYIMKTAKIRDDKKHKRRKPLNNVKKVMINGLEVEIATYDGFPVKKEDAQRLIELRKEMVLKGIPKSEIDVAMKLERRRCEKALARIRKQVCFHCRKAGHNLSDCPELGKEEAGTGICFKCGSTEHTHFECKVNKADDYKYAKCFICREQGHIAKQCPDNPKGLYPDGGSCKICGDVTHLKKDCPDLIKAKEDGAITLDTIKDENLELLENKTIQQNSNVKSIKTVKF